ncbi:MAG: hypothetical protein ACOX3W_02820 [Christensenellaceae bacterium]
MKRRIFILTIIVFLMFIAANTVFAGYHNGAFSWTNVSGSVTSSHIANSGRLTTKNGSASFSLRQGVTQLGTVPLNGAYYNTYTRIESKVSAFCTSGMTGNCCWQ